MMLVSSFLVEEKCDACAMSALTTALARWVNLLIDHNRLSPAFTAALVSSLDLIADHVRRGVRIEQADVSQRARPN
jgi:hypothetical protein